MMATIVISCERGDEDTGPSINGFVGVWKSDGGSTLILREDSTCEFSGIKWRNLKGTWSFSDGKILTTWSLADKSRLGNQGLAWTFTIVGDTLTIKWIEEGHTAVFSRV